MFNSSKGFSLIIILILVGVMVAIGVGGYYFGQQSASSVNPNQLTNNSIVVPTTNSSLNTLPTSNPSSTTINQSKTTSTPKPSTITAKKIPLVSTAGWKSVSLDGVSFLIPALARLETSDYRSGATTGLIYLDSSVVVPSRVSVEPYKGGSRRDQFFGSDKYDCHEIYEEALFGSVQALQIAADGGWCQGGAGGIVAVVGNKFVIFHNLYYDLGTKEINRFEISDTIISTLKLQ